MIPGMVGPYSMKVADAPVSFVFNGVDQYLSAAILSNNPNRRTYTISYWFKWLSVHPSVNSVLDALCFVKGDLETGAVMRVRSQNSLGSNAQQANWQNFPPSAASSQTFTNDLNWALNTWYHNVIAIDTAQSTAANRSLFYNNGTLSTKGGGVVNPAANIETEFMLDESVLNIGLSAPGYPGNIAGKVAFVQVVEGARLAASDFGQTDGGVWKHKKYTGSYGAHGLYLGTRGLRDTVRGLPFSPHNMDGSNLDNVDVPPFINF